MKNVLCLLIVLMTCLSVATAQTDKGNFLVGTQVGNLTVGSQNNVNTLSARLSPAGGYFIANRLAVGVGIPVFISRIRFDNNTTMGTYRASQIGLTPFIRYYFGAAALKPYLGASAGYTSTTIRSAASAANQPGSVTTDGFTYGLQLGLAYFITNRVSLDGSMNFADGYNGINQYTLNNPGLGVSQPRVLTLNVGFQLFFGH